MAQVRGHNMTHEFVSPDFFQNITGDPTNTASVFLTSTYGPLADKWQGDNGLYNYALFFIGSQPGGAGPPAALPPALLGKLQEHTHGRWCFRDTVCAEAHLSGELNQDETQPSPTALHNAADPHWHRTSG